VIGYYVHTDHLNTPRLVTDSSNSIRWRWESDPFGTTVPDENPAGVGGFVYNLRFPGQQFDAVTQLNYNYRRDYDPAIGRYTESDPIGLTGGSNTYVYAAGSPVSNFDPSGLECASTGGFIYCTYPDGGPSFRFPTQPGFPCFLGGDNFGNFMRYHKYDESVPLGSADAECVMQKLIENPTPQGGKPATKNGTRNNAAVFGMDNWITSYLTSDLDTRAPIVVNTTDSNSAFYPGYVARTVRNGAAHTYGEGLALSQAVPGPQGFGNWFYWKRQMEKIVQECSCRK
jgi:RHS repeat-associated protein